MFGKRAQTLMILSINGYSTVIAVWNASGRLALCRITEVSFPMCAGEREDVAAGGHLSQLHLKALQVRVSASWVTI